MWKGKDDCRRGNSFASKLAKKINLDKHFCFRLGTIVIIFLFIDVERHDR